MSNSVINHDQMQLEREGVICLMHFHITSIPGEDRAGTQGRNMGQELKAGITEKDRLLSCSQWPAPPARWYSQDPLPSSDTVCSGLTPPTISSILKTPHCLAYSHSDGGVFSAESPSSQMTLACAKSTQSQPEDVYK